jgi:hypothetical protein
VGQRAHPAESGQQPEASLASCGATYRAKRRQRVSEPAHSAPKLGLIAGAPAVRACGGRACSPVLAWEGGPAGVFRSRRGHLGAFKEHLPRTLMDPGKGLAVLRSVAVARRAYQGRHAITSRFSLGCGDSPEAMVVVGCALAQARGRVWGAGASITSRPKARALLCSEFTCCSRTRASYSAWVCRTYVRPCLSAR